MIHARSIITIYKRARDKRSRREKRDARRRRHTVRPRREELVQLPRRDRTRAKEAMVAMPMAEKQQVIARSTVVRSLIFHADPAKKSAESAAMVKLKGEELARGRVEGVDGDGEDGR